MFGVWKSCLRYGYAIYFENVCRNPNMLVTRETGKHRVVHETCHTNKEREVPMTDFNVVRSKLSTSIAYHK